MDPESLRTAARLLLAGFMSLAGIMHFVSPRPFEKLVPKALPNPRLLVHVSGVFEILGGVGLLVPFSREFAAWGLVALYVAVFPANVNQAVNDIQFRGRTIPRWVLFARLPLQALLVAWALWVR